MRLRKAKARPQPATELADELEVLRMVLDQYPGTSRLVFGAPTRCPGCGDYGIVDEVLAATGETRNHCHVCGAGWVITRRALRAYAAAASSEPDQAIGGGVLVGDLPVVGPTAASAPDTGSDPEPWFVTRRRWSQPRLLNG